MRTHALFLAGLIATLSGCGNGNADIICERLAACDCLTESAEACADRIADLSEKQLDLCGHCVETNDYMCHELASNHGACRRCTDDFASAGKGRDIFEDGADSQLRDFELSCIDVMPMPDAGTPGTDDDAGAL